MTFGHDPFEPNPMEQPWAFVGLDEFDAHKIDRELYDPMDKHRAAEVLSGRKKLNNMSDAELRNTVNNPLIGQDALRELNRRADEEAERRRLDEIAREDQYMGSFESTSHDGGTVDIDVSNFNFNDMESELSHTNSLLDSKIASWQLIGHQCECGEQNDYCDWLKHKSSVSKLFKIKITGESNESVLPQFTIIQCPGCNKYLSLFTD